MKKTVFSVMISAMGFGALFAAPGGAELRGRIPPSGRDGIEISNQDFVISRGSRVCVTTPNWSKVYLRSVPYPKRPPIKLETRVDGAVEAIAPTSGTGMVALNEYSVRCMGNRAEITLRVSAPAGLGNASIEHVALVLRAGILQGADYEITRDDGTTVRGVISMVQKNPGRRGLLPAFRKGVFNSALGVVTIEVKEGPALKLDDRRSEIFEGLGPAFIAWCDGEKFDADGNFVQKITMRFDYPVSGSARAVNVTAPAREPVMRRTVKTADFPLLPRPAVMTLTGKDFTPAANAELAVEGGSEQLLEHARKIAESWNMNAVRAEKDTGYTVKLVVGDGSSDKESYSLAVRADGIRINAESERAGFYALQTLRGLYRNGTFAGAVIEDHPAFAIRAVHAMADSGTLANLGPIIANVLAPLKINTLILECPYVKWETLAGMHHDKGMPKEELVELLRIARENYITVYPLVPTYSHSEWFFGNGHNREMMDNPKDDTAYNSLHPGVRPLLEKLFAEVLATFGHPEYFHISHDELCRTHPFAPEGKKLGVKTLLKNDILWHYEYFRKRNIKVMMWHDMLVSKEETSPRAVANAREGTERLRKELPADLTIAVWNYGVPSGREFPEVNVVSADGFPLIGAGWYVDGNLEALTRNCLKKNALGMMITTWHWKFDSAGVIYTQYGQIHSYVRAATLFWNPDGGIREEAPRVLVDLMRKPETKLGELTFIPLVGNTLLAPEAPEFAAISGDEVHTAEGLTFPLLRDGDGALAAVCVQSRRLPHLPNKVRIPLRAKFKRLHLLQTLLNRGMGKHGVAVKLVFRYKDGSYEAIYPRNGVDVAYGKVPVFYNDGKATFRPDEVGWLYDAESFQRNHYNEFSWQPPQGERCRVWSYTWTNPHPEKELDHLLIEAQDPSTTYALLSLTGENW